MALKATIHKARLQLADMDRNIYGDHELTIARHPSETDERMLMRVLAYALNVPSDDERGALELAKSLWDTDEPDLWQRDLTGEVVQWIELGFAYLSSQPVWRLAQPAMEDLVQDVHESCSAAVLDGDDIVYVLRVPANKIMSISLRVGSRLPAHCTSMGRVLLAGLPAPERRVRVERMTLAARTGRTITDHAKLLAVLDQVRRDGHALVHGELEEGLLSLAAPIVNRAGRVVAAINVSAHDQRIAPEEMRQRLLPRLLEAAASINTLMRLQD